MNKAVPESPKRSKGGGASSPSPYSSTISDILASIKAMSWNELLKVEQEVNSLCYGNNPCFSTGDLIYLDMLTLEIHKREQARHHDLFLRKEKREGE